MLALIDRDGTVTATSASAELGESTGSCSFHLRQLASAGLVEPEPGVSGRVKPWRRVVSADSVDGQARLNRELEDLAYADWLAAAEDLPADQRHDFAFSEVLRLSPAALWRLRARLVRLIAEEQRNQDTSEGDDVAVVIRAFPMRGKES